VKTKRERKKKRAWFAGLKLVFEFEEAREGRALSGQGFQWGDDG